MDEESQKKIDELNQNSDVLPEGVETYEPDAGGVVKNINQRDEKQQFSAQDIGFSSKDEKPKQERYTGPVTQASYQTDDYSQSFNSSTTTVHKSHARQYKMIALTVLLLAVGGVVAFYFLSI